jgi:hypothetical protein
MWTAAMIGVGFATLLLFRPFVAAAWPERFLADLPAGVRSFLGITALVTPAQFLDGVVFGLFAPIVFMTFGIGIGSHVVAGQDEAAAPGGPGRQSAGALVLARVVGLTVGAAIIGAGTWLGIMAGAHLANAAIDPGNVTAGIVADVLLGVAIGAVALLAGVITGNLGLAGWIATGVALAADGLHGLAAAVAPLGGLRYLSLLYYADGEPATRGITAAHAAALVAVATVISLLAASWLWRRGPARSVG